jgi:hypothetical protein
LVEIKDRNIMMLGTFLLDERHDRLHDSTATVEGNGEPGAHNKGLIQSVVRAHVWIELLREGTHVSIEKLAEATLATYSRRP